MIPPVAKRRIAILGCTGSVGTQALSILEDHEDRFDVCMLAAHTAIAGLEAGAARHQPAVACLTGTDGPANLPAKSALFRGPEGLIAALEASAPDTVLNAITGAAGLAASEWTLRQGLSLALANKESLVVAGEYLMALARDNGANILPVDSEHCAIFQCLNGEHRAAVQRVWLTGSGGPFRERPLETFAAVTPAEALKHPTWSMGPRITIGSATMMNKAFEVVEARWLFDLSPDQIQVVIHPQSIVHSMVEFRDGSMLAQCGVPDMRVPILYCLGYPDRLPFDFQPFDPIKWRALEFMPFEPSRYPAVALAYEAMERGGDAGCVLNAADEVATTAFLDGQIGFHQITKIAADVMRARPSLPLTSLQNVLDADRDGRARATEIVRRSTADSPDGERDT